MKELNNLIKDRKKIVFLDFEGTQFSQEIFAIGATKSLLDNKNQIKNFSKKFSVYIKTNEKIGDIVSNLTKITDEYILEKGISFKEALEKLKAYLGYKYDNTVYLTYGNFDMRLLRITSEINNTMDDPLVLNIFKNHVDFASFLSRFVRSERGEFLSLKDALKKFNITFKGNEHDPSSDAYNLGLLYEAFVIQKNIVFEEYKKILNSLSNFPLPIIKVIRKINKEGSCSVEEYENFIKETLK